VNLTSPASALGQRYLPHVEDLCAALARVAAGNRAIAPLLVLVWFRLRRTLARLDRLAIRWQRGRHHPRQRAATARPPRPHTSGQPRRTPQGQAWLIRLHQPLAALAPRIALLLEDPEILALCAAAPQAGRLLRPLARMFGLALPAPIAQIPGKLPPRPTKPPEPKPNPNPPPFAEHPPARWPFIPLRLRLRVPGLRRTKRRA
jgi:hypothetical protein